MPHPNVALFAALEPALSEAEGVGFHSSVPLGISPEDIGDRRGNKNSRKIKVTARDHL